MNRSSKTISVVIPHWNGIDVLAECLDSLKRSTCPNLEIIVVDNASGDGSQKWIKEHHSDIILIENDRNYGYAGGCNRGAARASGNYIVFLNNDTIQDSHWLEPLIARLEADSSIAAVQPKIRNYFQRDMFDYAGAAGGEMDILCYPFARGRIFETQEKDVKQYDNAKSIFWSSGTAFMVRKDVFLQAGGFDETFFAHMEEIDLCWRFQLMGYAIWAEPKSIVFHKNAVTLPVHSVMKYYLNHRNSLLMLLSNHSLPMAIYVFPLRFGLEWVAFFFSFIRGDWNHMIGILKALGWLLFHPGAIMRKRKENQRLRIVKGRKILQNFYQGSIVIAYYILGKKTYREILTSPRE